MDQYNPPQPPRPRSWFKPGNTFGFKKGQSGNPGGRPKKVREVEELAQAHSLEAIGKLAEIALNGPDLRAQLRAIEIMLDRALGKPPVVWHEPEPVEPPAERVSDGERSVVYPDGKVETIPIFRREDET